jgi:disulfide oxidoreductase YuzD
MRYIEIIFENYDEDRIFLAYCKKHKINIMELSKEEIDKLYKEAILNKDKYYPIPINDDEYFYHGTGKKNLNSIKQMGLIPSTNNRRGNAAKYNSIGRVFFTKKIENAEFYGLRNNKNYVLLRVKRDVLKDVKQDTLDDTAVYVEHIVPPNFIEIWNGHNWEPL